MAANSSFNLNADDLTKFVNEMKEYHSSILKQVDNARNHAGDLASKMRGDAGTQLQRSFENFAGAAGRMNDALLLNAENLEQVNKKYNHVEQDQLSHLQQAGGLLQWQP